MFTGLSELLTNHAGPLTIGPIARRQVEESTNPRLESTWAKLGEKEIVFVVEMGESQTSRPENALWQTAKCFWNNVANERII